MSTHVPGFQSFFRDFASFCMAKLAVMLKAGGNGMAKVDLALEGLKVEDIIINITGPNYDIFRKAGLYRCQN